MSKEFISALQEFLRTFIQGMVVPFGAAVTIIAKGINTDVGGFNVNWLLVSSILAVGALYALQTGIVSAIDKWLHKKGVETPLDFKSLDGLK